MAALCHHITLRRFRLGGRELYARGLRDLRVDHFLVHHRGGIAYTIGAICYAFRKPNPWPATFGYHELFISVILAAAAFQSRSSLRYSSDKLANPVW